MNVHIDNHCFRTVISAIVVVATVVLTELEIADFTDVRTLDSKSSRFDCMMVRSDGHPFDFHVEFHVVRKCLLEVFE